MKHLSGLTTSITVSVTGSNLKRGIGEGREGITVSAPPAGKEGIEGGKEGITVRVPTAHLVPGSSTLKSRRLQGAFDWSKVAASHCTVSQIEKTIY